MNTINDINFNGKRALLRVDFNVPLDKSFNVSPRRDSVIKTKLFFCFF